MEFLSLDEPPRLDILPTDVLLIVFSYLDTARSFASLAATCRGLNHLVKVSGWRIFVATCFRSLSLPAPESDDGWRDLSRVLTSQSRDWDRRAFVFRALSPPESRRPNGRARHYGNHSQSIPANIIVDAHAQYEGKSEKELVVWGAGEDIVARVRQKHGTKLRSETWHGHKGSQSGHHAGKDDTTSVAIVKGSNSGEDGIPGALVGRANGDLRLLSMDGSNFGETLVQFHPSSTEKQSIGQREIQAFDYCNQSGRLAAGTKENILLYPLGGLHNGHLGESYTADNLLAESLHAISLKDAPETTPFEFIRSVKYMNKDTIAVSLNKSFKPIYYLTVTPTGLSISTPASSTADDYSSLRSGPRTVRALLPVDPRSHASGNGSALLSSWDDGTIRLQDLRTPHAVDRIYQDNFEVSTPTNALLSYGAERFVAGSARTHMVKIFDFRQSSSLSSSSSSSSSPYFHTDALPCGPDAPHPLPKPPTLVAAPDEGEGGTRRLRCDHARGLHCRWHALSRHDFYRPNANVYLPVHARHQVYAGGAANSPVYSLAKASDLSPTLYAGMSGVLAELTLRSGFVSFPAPPPPGAGGPGSGRRGGGGEGDSSDVSYAVCGGRIAVLENGDGSPVHDVSKCQRVPQIRRQSFGQPRGGGAGTGTGGVPRRLPARRHRLDESLQLPSELPAVNGGDGGS